MRALNMKLWSWTIRRNSHEVKSPRLSRSKARLTCIKAAMQTTKPLHALSIFAQPSLAFDLVTRCDLAHLKWSNDVVQKIAYPDFGMTQSAAEN